MLAEPIASGQFEAHLRRMRRVYRGRRAALLEALARDLERPGEPGPSEAGLYLRIVLAEGLDEEAVPGGRPIWGWRSIPPGRTSRGHLLGRA